MAPYALVTFDCYGTLVDWESGIAEAFAPVTAALGLTAPRARVIALHAELEPVVEAEAYRSYAEVLAEVARRVLARLGAPAGASDGAFLPASLPAWRAFPDTNAALERLRGAGLGLGILSNVDDELLAATRRQFTVEFELVVTAAQVGSYKPAHGHWLEARRRGAGPGWLHAAQSYFHDVIPARAFGLPTAWVNRKAEAPLDGGAATHEVRDMAGLAGLLAR